MLAKRWMIVKSEATGAHYLYNGRNAVCIEHSGSIEPDIDINVTQWDIAAKSSRVRTIKTKDVKYSVISRGEFQR